jgi:surface antigen
MRMKRVMQTVAKLTGAALMALALAGCASDDVMQYSEMPHKPGKSVVQAENQKPVQCAPYAREHSRIKIFGDAYTWWDKASGKYPRGAAPQAGTVMVLHDYAGPTNGHVAVVRNLISAREIRVDHANWLNDGSIYVNDPVMDVSADNDWSAVRVYNLKTGGWGTKVYPVQGFIGSRTDLVAQEVGASMGATALVGEIN